MRLGYFTMPLHPVGRDWRETLAEDREAILLAEQLGFEEAFVGEHVTDLAETVTSCLIFIASLARDTRRIRLGSGTVNLANRHPAVTAAEVAMVDTLLEGRFILGIGPGGLRSDAEMMETLDADRTALFVEAIEHMIALWTREPPYGLAGKRWRLSTERTWMPEVGQGAMLKPFQRPHRRVAAHGNGLRSQLGIDGGDHEVRQPVPAGGVGLQHDHVAETVDDEAGQAVGLGMDEPVERSIEKPLAHGQRPGDPPPHEFQIDRRILVAGQHPRRDQRVRVEVRYAHHLGLRGHHPDHAARQQRLGGGVDLELVREQPRAAAAKTAIAPRQDADGRIGHVGIARREWPRNIGQAGAADKCGEPA